VTEPLVLEVPARLDARGVGSLAVGLEAAARASVVVLIGGAPAQFCLGMDFTEATGGAPREHLARFAALLGQLARCPRPTLAVIDGPALGGGLGLAAACDVVLASERARIGLPEALYGLAPAVIYPVLRARLSAAALRRLLFTCHSRDAREAHQLGLVDEVVRFEALAGAQRALVRSLARARSKTVLAARRWEDAALARALAAGVEETAAALADPAVITALLDEELPWRL